MKRPKAKRDGAPTTLQYADPVAVAICAKSAGIDLRRADVAMVAADCYWLAAFHLEGKAELERTKAYKAAEIAAVRAQHPDVFGRDGQGRPDARKLETYLQRTAGLKQREARHLAQAHAVYIAKASEASTACRGSIVAQVLNDHAKEALHDRA